MKSITSDNKAKLTSAECGTTPILTFQVPKDEDPNVWPSTCNPPNGDITVVATDTSGNKGTCTTKLVIQGMYMYITSCTELMYVMNMMSLKIHEK